MITYSFSQDIDLEKVKLLYIDSTLNKRRPIEDMARLKRMFTNVNLVISAWNNDELIGLCRGFTDFSYVTYISDLAVLTRYHSQGIGKTLIQKAHETGGIDTKIVLLSSPSANTYYEKQNFEHHPRAWVFPEGQLFS